MKKSFTVLLHVGFWLGYLLVVTAVMFAALQGKEVPAEDMPYYFSFVTGAAVVPPVVSFYLHYSFLFRRYLQQRKIALSVLMGVLLAAASMLVGFFWVYLTSTEAFGCIQDCYPYAIGFTLLLAIVFGAVGLVIKGFLTWFEELKLKEELLEKTHRMELALVKSQLDPHFLFNTINNIDVLISKNPEEASQYLNKLSDIMRFMLYETKAEQIPLAQELEYIDKFIQLQKIRTANENYVQYEVEGSPNQQQVAPMVFIPFIENAFKHATNKKIDRAVAIAIRIQEQAIVFSCRNKFDPQQAPTNGANGLGNELIERRLKLLYPARHTLVVDRQDDQYEVELTIHHGAA